MKKLAVLITALVVMALTSEQAEAGLQDVINLRMGSDTPDYTLGAAMDNTSGQAWNVLQIAGGDIVNNLVHADGSVTGPDTGVTVNYNFGGSYFTEAPGITNPDQAPLFQGFFYQSVGSTGTVEFSGLAAGVYNIYVYSQVTDDSPATLDLTTQTSAGSYAMSFHNSASQFTDLAKAAGTGDAGNWAKQTVVVGSNVSTHDGYSYNLVMSFAGGSSVNGIQIEAVPEPGSVVLLGVGGVFVFGFTRMRTKERASLGV
jgi:hypothetical protein